MDRPQSHRPNDLALRGLDTPTAFRVIGTARVGFGSSLSSNRSLECKPFLVPKLWFAGSSVVFAVETVSPHDGASQEEPSKVSNARCGLGARRCNRLGRMVRPRPGRDASARLRAGASEFSGSGGGADHPGERLAGFEHRVHDDDVLDKGAKFGLSKVDLRSWDRPGRSPGQHHRQPRCA